MPVSDQHRIAVLLPCYNEAGCIANVVAAFKKALPMAVIYVYDNNSTDNTAEVARNAGAIVGRENNKGKGNVVRRMFNDIEADIYVMADGDETYDATVAPEMIRKLVEEDLDMVVGARVSDAVEAYRACHRFGNNSINGLVRYFFGYDFQDILSGYRVMTRRFVKSFPIHSHGFEIETEMTIHAVQLQLPVVEVPTKYGVRPESSPSKLRTYRDGLWIFFSFLGLLTTERPRLSASVVALLIALFAIVFASTYLTLLAVAVLLFGFLVFAIRRSRLEAKRLAYLAQKHSSLVLEKNYVPIYQHQNAKRTPSFGNSDLS